MADPIIDKYREEAKEVAAAAHGAARDDRDVRSDLRTTRLLDMFDRLQTLTTTERVEVNTRVERLVGEVAVLKDQMVENTAITMQVRDILASFKVMASAAKWVAAIAGMIAAVLAVFKGLDLRR